MKRRIDSALVCFDLVYDDGGRASNRKMPTNLLGGLNGDEPARAFFEQEELKNSQRSGLPPRQIKSLARSVG